MECISCQAVIDPRWRKAIEKNCCPFCDGIILDENLKDLLSSLANTMTDLVKDFPQQVDDWLLSNYNYISTSSTNLKNYLSKEDKLNFKKEIDDLDFNQRKTSTIKLKMGDGTIQDVEVEKRMSDETTKGFFQRADIIRKPSKSNPNGKSGNNSMDERAIKLQALKQQIESGEEGYLDESALSQITEENNDGQEVGNFDLNTVLLQSANNLNSSLQAPITGENEELDPIAEALAQSKKSSTANSKDIQALKNIYSQSKNARERFEAGDQRGKGGFSRG